VDESVNDKSQDESFADDTMYEDVEYLDENDLEYMECIDGSGEDIQLTNLHKLTKTLSTLTMKCLCISYKWKNFLEQHTLF